MAAEKKNILAVSLHHESERKYRKPGKLRKEEGEKHPGNMQQTRRCYIEEAAERRRRNAAGAAAKKLKMPKKWLNIS